MKLVRFSRADGEHDTVLINADYVVCVSDGSDG